MNFLIKKSGLSLILFFLMIFLPSKALMLMWEQEDWSGGRGQEFWENSTMYHIGLGVNPWDEPGLLKLSRWSDCGDLEAASVHSFCQIGDTLYAGTGNSGDVYMSTDDGASWLPISCELLYAQNVYSLVPYDHMIYAGTRTYYGGSYYAKVFKISNGGTTCDTTNSIPAGGVFSLLFVGDTLYAGVGGSGVIAGKVYRSVDGNGWETTFDLEAQAILALLQTADGSIWAGGQTVTQGGVWRSTDGGRHWEFVTYLDQVVYTLIQDEAGAIYAGTGIHGRVFKTVDDGVTWDTFQLDPHSVYSLLKAFDGSLCAGTYSGYAYRSTNGNTWGKTGYLSDASIISLFQASDSLIYAGTGAGRIFKFGPFRESGWVESSIFDARCNQEYGWVNWIGSPGITFKVRTSSDSTFDMDWENCDPVEKLEDISGKNSVEDGDRFIQYWVELKTSDPVSSPILDLVQLDFTPVTDEIPPEFQTLVLSDTAYSGPFNISSVITDEPCCVEPESVYFYWSADGWVTKNEIHMDQSGDTFSAEVPRLPEGDSLWYYIRASDLAWEPNYSTDPPQGQDSSFGFWIVPEPPTIEFFPYDVCFRDTIHPGPYRIKCYVLDEGDGVDDPTVKLYYRYEWGEWQTLILTPIVGGRFVGWLPKVPDSEFNTKIEYYVEGCDSFSPPQCSQRPPYDPCSFYYIAAGDVRPLDIFISDIIHAGYTYKPSVLVVNGGKDLVPAFNVTCEIVDTAGITVWDKTARTASSLSGGEVAFMEFGEWKVPPGDVDYYHITVFTSFANDTITANDTLSIDVEVGVEEIASILIPKAFSISQNYPNPFSGFSLISYQLPDIDSKPIQTLIRIYDATGKIVKVLENGPKRPGYYTISWDGRNSSGIPVPSGIYFYKINAGDFTVTRKMIIIR